MQNLFDVPGNVALGDWLNQLRRGFARIFSVSAGPFSNVLRRRVSIRGLDLENRALLTVGEHVQQAVPALLHVANPPPQIDEQRLPPQLLEVLVDQDSV